MNTLNITQVRTGGPFLQIYGHQDAQLLDKLSVNINACLPYLQKTIVPVQQLKLKTIYLVKTNQYQYHRCILAKPKKITNNIVSVELIDYGIEIEVPAENLIPLDPRVSEAHFLLTDPAIATLYFLASFYCNWNQNQIDIIRKLLNQKTVVISKDYQNDKFKLISLSLNNEDVQSILLARGIGSFMDLATQVNLLMSIVNPNFVKLPDESPSMSSTVPKIYPGRNLVPSRPLQTNNFITSQGKQLIVNHLVPNMQRSRVVDHVVASNYGQAALENNYNGSGDSSEKRLSGHFPVFIATDLSIGSYHTVYCSYVQDGPILFSIQLKNQEHILDHLMTTLGNIPLQSLKRKPTFGMACIARYSEDKNYYRAAILNIQPTECRVIYVDYGNSENVSFSDIFEIPEKLLEPKVFAIQFTLAGCSQLEPIDDRIKEYFSNLVQNAELELKVMPLERAGFVQNCELYYKNRSILELLRERQMQFNTYSIPRQLEDNDNVIIRYVKSAQNFFVQRVVDIPKFEAMMDKLFIHCKNTSSLEKPPKINYCCAAMLGAVPNEWYRARVLDMHDNNKFSVEFVDYGHIAQCTLNQLKSITPEFLKLPRQASECCLIDFENVAEVPESARKQLEMLADERNDERKKFRVTLHSRATDSVYIVNLYDDSQTPVLNVSSTLYKHSMPRKPYSGKFSNKNILNTECVNSTTISDNSNSKTWSEIDKMSSSATTTDETVTSNKTSNWDTSNRSFEYQASSGRTSSNWETDEKRKNSGDRGDEAISSDRNNRFNENVENNFRGPRSSKSSSNWSESNSELRKSRDPDQEWRSDDQHSNNYNRRPDRRSNDFNYKRERPVLQKHLIPRFNRHNRPSSGNPFGNENFSKNHNYPSDISISDSSGFYSKADSPGKSTPENRSPNEPEEIVPFGTKLPEALIPLNGMTRVTVLLWISPHEFYVQLKSCESDCDEMMNKIQLFYKDRKSTKNRPNIGDIVIVRHRKDNSFKRAKILNFNSVLDKYRVQFIDFGTKSTCQFDDIYDLEKSFIRLSPMAIWCSLQHVVKNVTREEIEMKIDQYINEKQNIQCVFLSTVGDITFVELNIEGRDFKQALIDDGLMSLLPPDCNLQRLVGQVTTVNTTDVKDLSCFWVKMFGCETKLMCCFKDMKFAKQNPNLSAEFKHLHENDYFTVKVDAVTTDNVLVLTIYLPVLTDEIGPETPACPLFADSFDCKVVHIESVCEFYIQNSTNSQYLTTMLNDMFYFYEKGGNVLMNPSPGDICAALSADGNYYRARINEINNENFVEIFLIDYGNCETVPKSNIKVLTPKFKYTSALAVKVFLPMKRSSNFDSEEAVIKEIKTLTEGYTFQFKVLDIYKSNWIANIESHGFSMIDVLRQKGLVENTRLDEIKEKIDKVLEKEKRAQLNRIQHKYERQQVPKQQDYDDKAHKEQMQPHQAQSQDNQQETQPQEQPTTSNVIETEVAPANAKIPNTTPAYISHVDRPDSFYLHLDSISDDLSNFQQSLQLVGSSIPPLTDFRTGANCVAKYSVDDQWYRAQIIDTDGRITSIRFTDYGNTDTITDNALLKCGGSFESIQSFAIHCSLPIQPRNSREWSDEACTKIRDLSNDQLIHFERICQSSQNKTYVNLFYGEGRDVTKELIIEGYAEPLEIIKSGEKCYVSHVNSLNDFFIQMDSDSSALQLIEDYFSDVSKFGEVTEFKKGSICIAQFEDEKFYRARILDGTMTEDGLKVFFIDYGNTFMAKNVRALPQDIAELQQLLKKCSMKLPNGVKEWSEEAEKKFVEIAISDSIFRVQLTQPGRKAVVELFIDDRNIGELLAEFCEKGAPTALIIDEHEISHEIQTPLPTSILSNVRAREPAYITQVNSLDSLYVQLEAKTEELEVMVANLRAAYDLPSLDIDQVKVGDICAAKFIGDDVYYRAKVLNKILMGCNILFIDYGNESFATDLRVVPSVLQNAEPLAIHCKLSPHTTAWSDQDHKYFSEITNPNDTFQIEIIDCTKMPCVINLYKEDQNLRDLVLQNHLSANTIASHDNNLKQTEDLEINNNVNTSNSANIASAVAADTVTKTSEADNVAGEIVSNMIQTAIQSQ